MFEEKQQLKTPWGDSFVFVLVSSLIGGGFFVFFGLLFGIFSNIAITLPAIITEIFFWFFLEVFAFVAIFSLLGRIIAYPILRHIYNDLGYSFEGNRSKPETNRYRLGFTFLVTSLITAFVFATGMLFIVQQMFFPEEIDGWTLLFSFVVIKIFIWLIVRGLHAN